MILYLADRSKDDPLFGAVKLAKLMFFSDFIAFREIGQSISGLEYRKLPQGPVPTAAKSVMAQLQKKGSIHIEERKVGRTVQSRVVSDVRPTQDFFEPGEVDVMDKVLTALRPRNASEVSNLSHHFIGWQTACDNEVIPYSVSFISKDQTLSAKERDFAKQFIPCEPA